MIKFFRQIRQRLLTENKFSKYLLYAIGEIVLVVVGILIALQINNWNENQKRNRLEISLISEMKENLQNDLQDIRNNIKEDSDTWNSNKLILKHIEEGLPYNDSLSIHFGQLQRTSTLVANTSAYENLKSIGFNLISNDSLRKRITNLYSAKYHYINSVHIGTNSRIVWEHLNPMLLNIVESNEVLVDATPTNYKSLQNNLAFKEVLRWHISIKNFVININKDTEKEIIEIVRLINQEIENKE